MDSKSQLDVIHKIAGTRVHRLLLFHVISCAVSVGFGGSTVTFEGRTKLKGHVDPIDKPIAGFPEV